MKRLAALVMIWALLALSSSALAEGPGEALQSATVRVLKALQDREPRESGTPDERRNQVRAIANGMFDWQETGRQVLSRHWESLTPQERDEFAALFGDVVQRSYLGRVQTYQGEEMAMVLLDETIDGERAAVRTKLVTKSNILPITYRFIEHEEGWKIYDVAIDGISFLSSSRSQIGRLIQLFGYGGMMNMLKMKQSQLVGEEGERHTEVSRVGPNP